MQVHGLEVCNHGGMPASCGIGFRRLVIGSDREVAHRGQCENEAETPQPHFGQTLGRFRGKSIAVPYPIPACSAERAGGAFEQGYDVVLRHSGFGTLTVRPANGAQTSLPAMLVLQFSTWPLGIEPGIAIVVGLCAGSGLLPFY